jgi:hypothetical protein
MQGVSLDLLGFLSLVATIIATVGIGVWTASVWLGGQFKQVHEKIDNKIEKLERLFVDKMEYHERHDDQRFNTVQNDVWQIRLENAAREGKNVQISRTSTNG